MLYLYYTKSLPDDPQRSSKLLAITNEKQITAFLKSLRLKCSSPTHTYSWTFPVDLTFCLLLVFRTFCICSMISWATELFLKYYEKKCWVITKYSGTLLIKPSNGTSKVSWINGVLCGSRKNPYPPHGGSLEIPRGEGWF